MIPTQFEGFDNPKENWSKLPNSLIDALPLINSLGELKVILYILRHTWGYHEDERRISLDEFQHGRKRRDGTRSDNGVGMAKKSIQLGIKKALTHGFIVIEKIGDKGREQWFYSLPIKAIADTMT